MTSFSASSVIQSTLIFTNHDKPYVVAFDAFDEFKTIDDARCLARILIDFAPDLLNITLFVMSQQVLQLYKVLNVVEITTLHLHEVEESLVKSDIQ
jgi:hypothetical protein